MRRRNHDSRRQKAKTSEEAVIKLHIDEYLYKGNDFKDILLSFHRGVVHSQIRIFNPQKSLWMYWIFSNFWDFSVFLDFFGFYGFFRIFSDFFRIFLVYEDLNKKGFKH